MISDKRNSQSVSTLPHLVLSVFFTADVTQKTGTLATHSEEPVIVSNSTLNTYLVGRWFISLHINAHLPLPDCSCFTTPSTLPPAADGAF